ncbi:bacteriohemerythrin [Desulfoprunum benzoelyticum]|uniref:Diguanylate cyclase (GGDEF)-like protein/hemerythrin-like metal-binding protein/PAS domain S-box-containing protein n=1 Tax=Desulfoprunum benzoelyticum TaxID=1506996 RepID=A0A840UVD0_9BACT|nr:bacteriohemerythrin [Desulfoprunum benzoelyticum]MBB5346678.1 diguanylate cyclase (GGDEF)-like protein/hemerythrin-like metal-binding protein/PAS domain S-box-containing protein [Desulfoprunum benzoelyticum]MBM9529077.1 bacteriohemerythrin [Desulfoprunum benzoelyticum]
MNSSARHQARFSREWLIFSLSMIILGLWHGYFTWYDYQHIESRERQRLATQARVIENLIALQLEAIGGTLAQVRQDLGPEWRRDEGLIVATGGRLEGLVKATTSLGTIAILDAAGLVVTSNLKELVGKSFPQRNFFQTVRKDPQPDTLYVGSPYRTSLGAWTINLSRAIIDDRGHFAGVVTASLDPATFKVVLNAVLSAPDAWSALVHEDGGLLVIAAGGGPDRSGMPGVADIGAWTEKTGAGVEVFKTTADPPGRRHLVGIRSIEPAGLKMDQSLTVAVSRDLHAVFTEWRLDTLVHGALYLLVVAIGGCGLFVMHRRRQCVETAAAGSGEARATVENFFAIAPDLLCIADLDGRFRKLNPSWEKLLGYPLAEMEGTPLPRYLHPEDVEPTLEALSALAAGRDVIGFVNRFRRRDGSYHYIEWRSAVRDDLIFASARDVTEHKEMELRLKHMAYHDRLTGLANRSLLFGRLSHSLSAAGRNNTRVAILFIDLDGFKEVNDSSGHESGDIVLKTVAERFQSAVRASDTVARIGGDEFVVVLADITKTAHVGPVAGKLLASLESPIALTEGRTGRVGASIGISIYPDNGREMDELLEAADTAMYQCKRSGKNRYLFSDRAPFAEAGEDGRIVLGETYLLGITVLDEQHRRMTELVNLLIDAVRTDAGDDRSSRLLNELVEYTTSHFNTERELMERFDYPDRATHNASHDYLLVEIADFGEQLAQQGKLFMVKLIRDWLLQHIAREDRPLGRFLRDRMADNHSERIASDGC